MSKDDSFFLYWKIRIIQGMEGEYKNYRNGNKKQTPKGIEDSLRIVRKWAENRGLPHFDNNNENRKKLQEVINSKIDQLRRDDPY